MDLPGMNYRSYALTGADPQLCADDCANDTDCMAFTYVNPGFRWPDSQPECWLKYAAATPVSDDCCISGKSRKRKDRIDIRAIH